MLHPLHQKAKQIAKTYLVSEKHLIEVLEEIDSKKLWRDLGYGSFFDYAVKFLELSESQSYTITSIARKCREVPELKQAITSNRISISNAKRVLPVITKSNNHGWIEKAVTLSSRNLEKEVAIFSPRTKVREEFKPITEALSKFTVCVSEETEIKFKKAQNLLSRTLKKNLSYEEALKAMSEMIIEKIDPVEKAKRANRVNDVHKPYTINSLNTSVIPAQVKHAVALRDQNQCQAKVGNSQCTNTRFIDLHHIKHKSQGGTHSVDNLITLCSTHHKAVHRK